MAPDYRRLFLHGSLSVATEEMPRQGLQGARPPLENAQGGKRPAGQSAGHFAGFFQADDRRISRFSRAGVLARRLAQMFAGLGNVKYIVNDLEGQSDVAAKLGRGPGVGRACPGRSSPPDARSSGGARRFFARGCSGAGRRKSSCLRPPDRPPGPAMSWREPAASHNSLSMAPCG